MKTLLIVSLLIASFFFTGCEAIVETRRPVRYGTVYDRPNYYDDNRHDYYYRNGRRYDRYQENRYREDRRDVVVVNRPVVVCQNDVYVRNRPRVVSRPAYVDRRDPRTSSDRQRDERNERDKKKKKKNEDDRS